ncbi:hypothetical protein IFM89_016028 [Coptis chinensis]|uniref:Uncharacterized protein n=1 Tax=Coptis chinensis TaxID=261450 RepID=A0A835H6B8_9MAGN|nr:hypothetical protein IFM89_016028 [Coptis chinensis]
MDIAFYSEFKPVGIGYVMQDDNGIFLANSTREHVEEMLREGESRGLKSPSNEPWKALVSDHGFIDVHLRHTEENKNNAILMLGRYYDQPLDEELWDDFDSERIGYVLKSEGSDTAPIGKKILCRGFGLVLVTILLLRTVKSSEL